VPVLAQSSVAVWLDSATLNQPEQQVLKTLVCHPSKNQTYIINSSPSKNDMMQSNHILFGMTLISLFSVQGVAQTTKSTHKIVLIAGEITKVDAVGHHDYPAGVRCLDSLLKQTPGMECTIVDDGWPTNEAVFENAKSIVFYTDGGGKQAFLSSAARIKKLQSLADEGIGIVMIHQAVDFPDEFGDQAKSWLGGAYLKGKSGRGHWDSSHVDFPTHPVTRGVTAWKINDGWLNGIEFVADMKGITPLLWSGKKYAGSRAGLQEDIVAWLFERPDGGRSFSFTGLDAHSAWKLDGMRQLVVNGVLWTARIEIPAGGAACKAAEAALDAMQTPREAKPKKG
jgi:Trehalose utilisation